MSVRSTRRTVAGWIVVAVVCIVLVTVGLVADERQTVAAFTAAYVTVLSVVLGTMAMAMIAELTTANWFASFRREAMTVMATLPVLALFAIVLVALAPWQYGARPADSSRALYMHAPFVALRAAVYWAGWLGIAWALRTGRHSRGTSSVGLVLLAITMTFASFDWMMSLSADWYSTIYGVYWFAGGMVGALALIALLARHSPSDAGAAVPRDDWHALGKLLFTFVLFWAYIGFAQYIVIWSGNLPREVTWYVARTRGGWGGVALTILTGAGAIPFLFLLFRRPKRNGSALGGVAVLLLVSHYFDDSWLVIPGLAAVDWGTVALCIVALGAVVAPMILLVMAGSRAD